MLKSAVRYLLFFLALPFPLLAQTSDFTSSKVHINSSYAYLLRIDAAGGLGFKIENESTGDCRLDHNDLSNGLSDRIEADGFEAVHQNSDTFLRFSYHCQLDEAGHYLLGYRISLEQKPALRSAIDRELVTQKGNDLHFPLMDLMGVLHVDQQLLGSSARKALETGTEAILARLDELRKEADAVRSSR